MPAQVTLAGELMMDRFGVMASALMRANEMVRTDNKQQVLSAVCVCGGQVVHNRKQYEDLAFEWSLSDQLDFD